MNDIIVIGAGPAGLLAAWIARQRGARVRVLAAGIGTTHVSPGWIGILNTAAPGESLETAVADWTASHPRHPYALAGPDMLQGGIAALREVCRPAGLDYVSRGSLAGFAGDNFLLPTALGATAQAALVPESFAAGDLRAGGAMLIAGPAGWRDFYPRLCAENLACQGFHAHAATFSMPEADAGRFDMNPLGLARLFDQPRIRERVAYLLKSRLDGAARVGLPAVLGLERHAEAWRDLQERLGLPVFEIPTLPPSVPGIRLFQAFKSALATAGVQLLLDMPVARGLVDGTRASGIVVPAPSREATYRAGQFILATGGLYGGGITTDHTGDMREAVFDLPLERAGEMSEWFGATFLAKQSHPIHMAGLRCNAAMQPVDDSGRVLLENVQVAGRLLAGYNPLIEGSAEGVWLASAYRAAA